MIRVIEEAILRNCLKDEVDLTNYVFFHTCVDLAITSLFRPL